MSHSCLRGQRLVTRSIAFEVLDVTQFTSHCLRISLLADEVEESELISGQELLLAHVGTVGAPCRWIVRECDPRTRRVTVGAILGLGSLEARRWGASVVPGEMVRGAILTAPASRQDEEDLHAQGRATEVPVHKLGAGTTR
jgi:hypothetical protein